MITPCKEYRNLHLKPLILRHDTHYNDIQHNDTQHNDIQHKGLICDNQHK